MCRLLSAGVVFIVPLLVSLQVEAQRVIIEGIDRYRICEGFFEGLRVILSNRGEEYSPVYICGISGAAFRISGPCPCGPGYGQVMDTTELARLLGYESEHLWLMGDQEHKAGKNPMPRFQEILARVKQEIQAGQPVLMFHVFTNYEWDVVCGFDDEKEELYGRGSYKGLEGYAQAKRTHPLESEGVPLMGAIIIGEKTGELDAHTAELAALKEAVAHAHSASGRCSGTYGQLGDGLECYDRWIAHFRYTIPGHPGLVGADVNASILSILRTTRRAASQFMLELAPKYPEVSAHFEMAAEHFAREADALDSCYKLFPTRTQEEFQKPENHIRAAAYLRQARAMYALAIDEIARALPKIDR